MIIAAVAKAGPLGRISLSQAGFVSSDYKQTETKNFFLISAGLDTLSKVRSEVEIENSMQAQIRGMMVPGVSVLNYLDISQLYWKQELFSVGRKKVDWSRLDENFKLGVYQPTFKWNALQTDSQGLTGIFIHLEPEATMIPWGITLFGSPIYIPNQGPGYEIKDGKFEKNNPYFSTPPSQAEINGQRTEFLYTIEKPELNEIISHESYAGRAFLGKENDGFHLQAAYAQKPNNELDLGFQGVLIPGKKIDTKILPKVMYHTVLSGEAHYSWTYLTVGVEVLRDTPQNADFDSPWTYAYFSESELYSSFVSVNWKEFELMLASLAVRGGDATFIGPRSGEAENVLVPKYPYRDATQAKAKYQYRLKRNQNIALSTSYLRGAEGEFDLWNSTVAYQFQDRWAAQLTSQLVAVKPVDSSQKTVYHAYPDNDLVAIGVSYVF